MGLDLDLFGQAFIVLAQDGHNFVTTKVIGKLAAFAEHLAKHGAGEQYAFFLGMRAGAQRGHAVAFVTVEGPVNLQRLAQQRFAALGARDLVEDGLGFEHAVKIAYAGCGRDR